MLHETVHYLAAEGPGSDTFLVALVTTSGAVLVTLIPILVRRKVGSEDLPKPANTDTTAHPPITLSPYEQDLVDQRRAAEARAAASGFLAARLGRWIGYYREKLVRAGVDPGPDVTEEQDPPP